LALFPHEEIKKKFLGRGHRSPDPTPLGASTASDTFGVSTLSPHSEILHPPSAPDSNYGVTYLFSLSVLEILTPCARK